VRREKREKERKSERGKSKERRSARATLPRGRLGIARLNSGHFRERTFSRRRRAPATSPSPATEINRDGLPRYACLTVVRHAHTVSRGRNRTDDRVAKEIVPFGADRRVEAIIVPLARENPVLARIQVIIRYTLQRLFLDERLNVSRNIFCTSAKC